ncbi:alpha/beta hydrolase [Nocardia sp. NPDC051321]|uniref:alpha/beta hydrolase n=1 Tax=Nocardia sp. NPDC051321 TaxID=3364323 RepID=UPI00378AC914
MSPDLAPLTALTVSQVKNWKPNAFDQQALEWQLAAQALRARMTTSVSAVDGSHDYWIGDGGDAMRARFTQVNNDATKVIDALANGAGAARGAAGNISSHRFVVVNKASDAEANKYTVADDGTVSVSTQQWTTLVASVGVVKANQMLSLLKNDAKLRTDELKKALADLRTADVRAESAIQEAFKDLPTPPDFGPPRWVKPTPKPPAKDASVDENRHWWNSLTAEQQRDFITNHPAEIGNRDGIPASARDQANRNQIPQIRATLEQAITTAQAAGADPKDYQDISNRLNDLNAVDKAVDGKPDRKLLLLDMYSGRQGRAAIAVGDPDKADHISVTAPGLNTTVRDSIGGMSNEATNLRDEAQKQLDDKGRKNETVSTIAWIGYDPPQIPGWPDPNSLVGGNEVARDDVARAGAVDLSRFYNGLEAANSGDKPPHITAVGHSYGSLTTGLALQQPGGHPVIDMVVYGSPGIEANSPADLGLQTGHGYVMRAEDDPIRWTQDGPAIAKVPLPGAFPIAIPGAAYAGEAAGYGDFGPDPAKNTNFTQLDTHAGFTADGRWLDGASGHSEYPQQSNNQPRITGYNVAAIVAGLPENVVPAR